MTHVITEQCIRAGDCVEVCPVDCIVPGPTDDDEWTDFYIDPQACIDCGACVPVCPVDAIYAEADVPGEFEEAKERNKAFFDDGPGYWDFDLEEQRE